MKQLSLILVFVSLSTSSWSMGRLDPHGRPNEDYRTVSLKQNTGCMVCHELGKKGEIKVSDGAGERCNACHGQLPHSGIKEHAAKGIGCIMCHRPHRFAIDQSQKDSDEFVKQRSFIAKKATRQLPDNLEDRKSEHPMIQMTCVTCHQGFD